MILIELTTPGLYNLVQVQVNSNGIIKNDERCKRTEERSEYAFRKDSKFIVDSYFLLLKASNVWPMGLANSVGVFFKK